jgi:ATP-dependent helicase/nuclease subunit A
VKKSLEWQYDFIDVYDLPAKNSVTQLTHYSDEYVKSDYSRALDRQPRVLLEQESSLAVPIEQRLIGTATHLVISQLDLTGAITKEAVEKTKNKLLADNAITASVAENIDVESILAFFHSELGRLALDADNTVFREWPFTFALPACELIDLRTQSAEMNTMGDETIIVQGIIDMLIQTPKGLVIIDFKTDRIIADQVAERAELYRYQLKLYGRAASAILKSECTTKLLYFLTPRVSKEV